MGFSEDVGNSAAVLIAARLQVEVRLANLRRRVAMSKSRNPLVRLSDRFKISSKHPRHDAQLALAILHDGFTDCAVVCT